MCRSMEEKNLCALAITSSQASSLGMQRMEEKFNLALCSWENHKDTQFYNGHQALVVECWLKIVEEDTSGLIFEEWDSTQDAHASRLCSSTRRNCVWQVSPWRAEKSDFSIARGSGARRHALVRGGSAPTSGYGS